MKDSGKVKYYSKDDLHLRPSVPGAKMWAVALDKAMFTYFEIEPNSVFDMHSHESEQITMVLEGELFFNFDNEDDICVKAGEVIALPANLRHGAYTKERFVKAVDAWSPVRDEYK
jgi:quercetin dioxygenase-like cupin family protein